MSMKVLIILGIVAYVGGYFCSYLFARYSGEDEGTSLGMSLLWPFLIVVYPLFCCIEKFSVLGRYFYCLGKKHRGESRTGWNMCLRKPGSFQRNEERERDDHGDK